MTLSSQHSAVPISACCLCSWPIHCLLLYKICTSETTMTASSQCTLSHSPVNLPQPSAILQCTWTDDHLCPCNLTQSLHPLSAASPPCSSVPACAESQGERASGSDCQQLSITLAVGLSSGRPPASAKTLGSRIRVPSASGWSQCQHWPLQRTALPPPPARRFLALCLET